MRQETNLPKKEQGETQPWRSKERYLSTGILSVFIGGVKKERRATKVKVWHMTAMAACKWCCGEAPIYPELDPQMAPVLRHASRTMIHVALHVMDRNHSPLQLLGGYIDIVTVSLGDKMGYV